MKRYKQYRYNKQTKVLKIDNEIKYHDIEALDALLIIQAEIHKDTEEEKPDEPINNNNE